MQLISSQKRERWSANGLEARLMLAGDAGAAVADASATVAVSTVATEQLAVVQTDGELVLIAPDVANVDQVIANLDSDAQFVLLNAEAPLVDQISDALAGRRNLDTVHVVTHGGDGQIALGEQTLSTQELLAAQDQVRGWAHSLGSQADILLYGCDIAATEVGQSFAAQLAAMTGADVAASVDRTGNEVLGGDWDLEYVVGSIDSSLALTAAARDQFASTLPITIRAAGVTNEEEIIVEIDGEQVATINGIGGDAYAGVFEEYTLDIDGAQADQVRIAFVNDIYNPEEGIDNNVRIDNITVDGVVFETEATSTFSTGTWTEGEGVVEGFRQSEFLHVNGAFTYDQLDDADVSQVRIFAKGSFGAEAFEVRVDGLASAAWSDIGTEDRVFSFETTEKITASQIQVVFVNDNYEPSLGIDYNLIVDAIEVDGVRFESEAASTYGTGLYTPETGVTDGFLQQDTLFANGYFQYDSLDLFGDDELAV